MRKTFPEEFRETQRRALAIIALIHKEQQLPAPDAVRLGLLETWLESATAYLQNNKPRFERYIAIIEVLNGSLSESNRELDPGAEE